MLGFIAKYNSEDKKLNTSNLLYKLSFLYNTTSMKLNSSNSSPYPVLNDSELLFKMVFNQQFQFMAILSPEGRVLEVNELALTSQGVAREDYVGKLFWNSPAWCNFPEWENIWKQRLVKASNQQSPVITEDIFQIEDGSVHSADASTTAIYDPHNGKLSGYIVQAIDTTKRRLRENQIKENEARLKFVLEHSHIGHWDLNLIDHTSNRSLRHDQIFGYDSLLPQWTYEMFLEHVIPEERADVDNNFQKAIKNKQDWEIECRIIRKDGEIRWVLASGGHVVDTTGEAKLMSGVVQDVTEQKRAEINELRHSAELKSLIKALPDTYFRMMSDGTILDYHAPNVRELYLKPDDFLGKRMQDVLPQNIGGLFQSKIDEMAQAEKTLVFKYELIINNEVSHFDARLNRITLNDQLICVIRDVTEQNHFYDLLQESQAQAQLGSWEQTFDNENLFWSNEVYRIFEYDPKITMSYEQFIERVHPDDRSKVTTSFQSSFEKRIPYQLEHRLLFPDGRIKYVMERAEHFYDNNKHIRTQGTVQDITDRKIAENTLQQSEATIRKKLKAILEPDADIDALELSDIIDAEGLQSLMNDFYELTGMLGAVLDIKGNILVAVGWQDICTQFHRCHPDTQKNCIESDTILTHGVEQGTFKAYHCKNNMWDMVTPIVIGGKHLGNVFIGQFFYEDEVPDVGLFKEQAKRYGFDEQTYLGALDRVPRFTRDEVAKGMHFYAKLADIISASSFSAIKQSRLLAERILSEEKLKLAASVFTHARESIVITDAAGIILDVNDNFTYTTGYSREESIGKNPRILQSGRQSPEFYAEMWKGLKEENYWSGEIWNRRKNGEVYAEIKTISAVRDVNGITTHYVALGNDITPMKAHQDQLEHIAHYDILTNLPNRVLLADRLSQAMLQCSRNKQSLAVVFLDLDGFKAVNDAYGHDMGDELLIALSVRMKGALREGDSLARIGGDEFVAVLTGLNTVEDCEPVLERFLLASSEPVTVDDVVLNVSASIGVTLYPQDNVDADQLMRHADQAMYVAKESGKNRYHLFDTAQDDAVKVQRESIEAIRIALNNHQFVLYYQPKINMRTGKVTGFEALIRWQHPERGLLNPIEFLPIIENHAISIEMGEWVIDAALSQISQWQAMGLNLPLSTSVNVAAVQLQQANFVDRLTTLLAAHPDVEPRYLELEVLETSALEDVQHVSTMMTACMALGVNFALDDFGTGYSSLTYLRRLPANLIKIDQTFVRDMLIDVDDLAIVEGVIGLAKSFKRDVIAEGVETIEHGTALLQLGCELAQGYGIARPMPGSDIPVWINDWKPDTSWQTQIKK